jgi:CRISPR-associated protein Csx16
LSCTWFVSRHPGAVEWAARQGLAVQHWVPHLDVAAVQAGDTVIGTLPIHLAAQVCAQGARYLHLSLDLPAEWRGRELAAGDLALCGARLEAFVVHPEARCPANPPADPPH